MKTMLNSVTIKMNYETNSEFECAQSVKPFNC